MAGRSSPSSHGSDSFSGRVFLYRKTVKVLKILNKFYFSFIRSINPAGRILKLGGKVSSFP